MKRLLILSIFTLLFIAGCSGIGREDEEIVQIDDENEDEISIIPRYQLADDQYKIILPYRPAASRGAITNQIANRLDINELEDGLRKHSTTVYDPEKLLFEEGQYLDKEKVFELITELNPPQVNLEELDETDLDVKAKKALFENDPRVFSHIVEQNFLKKTEGNSVELVGLSIGISLKSLYQYQIEPNGASYYEKISKKEMLAEGKEVANKILEHLRETEELEGVPIMIGLFREEEKSSPIPGNYVAKTYVKGNEVAIGEWETINEEYVLLPSGHASKNFPEDHQKVKKFADKVSEYFPNYVGVIGEGFYVDETLQRLSLEIPMEFYGRGEVVGFTQYAYGLVQDIFSTNYDIEVEITSSSGMESLIYRKSGEDEAKVHILN